MCCKSGEREQQMKAWVLHDIGDFKYDDVCMPVVQENEVLLAVKATGICGSDVARVFETGAHRMPLVPGHEFSGEVVQVGKSVDDSWQGKRVGVFPLIPCKKCATCREKKYEMCRNYSYLGSRQNGGFAEYVAVPEWNLIPLPETVSFEEAAMLEPMAVAVHAMRRIQPDKEATVMVCGLGTIGMLLALFLREAGVRNILMVGNKEFQFDMVQRLGFSAEQYCDSSKQDVAEWIQEKTEGNGVAACFECVGKNETVSLAVDCCAPGGKVCLVGNPYTDLYMEKSVYWKILRNQLTVIGTWNSSFTHNAEDDWHYVLKRLEQKSISPELLMSHKVSYEELGECVRMMRDKTEHYLKVMGVC